MNDEMKKYNDAIIEAKRNLRPYQVTQYLIPVYEAADKIITRLQDLETVLGDETVQYLLEDGQVFVGSHWVEDETVKDGMFPGSRWIGYHLCVNCNDFFWWGTADAEGITAADLLDLKQAMKDCNEEFEFKWGQLLWCARKRKMRPQGPYYSSIPKELWGLFNACGDEREVDCLNPCKPGEYKK